MMKRWVAALAALVMLFAMTACSADEVLKIMGEVGIEEEMPPEIIPEALPEEDLTELSEEDAGAVLEEESPEIIYPEEEPGTSDSAIPKNGVYTHKDDVALYIYTYGELPDNFITKDEARDLGWPGGGLDDYALGMCIGGDRFGNYEGLLPEAEGRTYTECDIDTLGADSRGAKRIVFSNDGLIYYTEDHYESFELLYGTP